MVVAYLGSVDLDFDVTLSAGFCLGRWEFGRISWAGRQGDGTSRSNSTQPRSATTRVTLHLGSIMAEQAIYNALNSFPSKRPLEIRMKKKKKRFVPDHFGRPLGGFLGLGMSPAMKPEEGISAIREQSNKVIEGLRKVHGLNTLEYETRDQFLSFSADPNQGQ